MTTTTGSAGRFALDEEKAAEMVARNPSEHYAPGKEGTVFASATTFLVYHAVNEGAVHDPLHRDAETLGIEITGAKYRWLLSIDVGEGSWPDGYLTLASPLAELDALTERTGQRGAMDVLRQAVTAGNMLAAELDAYAGSLPLSARAPEAAGGVILGRDQLEAWAGRALTDDEVYRIGERIPHSSIPDAIDLIADQFTDEAEED